MSDLVDFLGGILVSGVVLFVVWPLELAVILGLGRQPASPRLESEARKYLWSLPRGPIAFVLCFAALAILQTWPISQLLNHKSGASELAGALCLAAEVAMSLYIRRGTRSRG